MQKSKDTNDLKDNGICIFKSKGLIKEYMNEYLVTFEKKEDN